MNKERLFLASCIALIATAMSFAIRGDIMAALQDEYVVPMVRDSDGVVSSTAEELIKTRLGVIGGAAFFSFGLTIFFGGPLVDLLGMGALLRLAAACHIGGSLLTIFAPHYYVVVIATLIVGAGNGLVEAVCNPLIATVYPDRKTQKLTLFHAWFPGGIVIGGLLCIVFTRIEWNWQLKMATILVPAVIYTYLILGQKFPATERVAAGVPFSEMFAEALRRPLFIIIFVMMWLTAATELGPGTWIANLYTDVMKDTKGTGILFLVWGSGIMWALRQFFSHAAHRVSPVGLIMLTAPLAAIGLYLFRFAHTPLMWFVASGLLYTGFCFWWPTMLGITTERCPKTGALGLAIIGGTGSFSTSLAGPVMGWINDKFGADKVLQIWAVLPVVITVVFALIFFHDKAMGGYKVEKLESHS
ncbi:MAG: MFS transporter [Candidatus Hydrogenedentes bacterium]|nr:MFS transporter [Candidatus Hydrogenedentota bacterium]